MRKWWYKIPMFLALAFLALLLFGFIVLNLWNWLIPALFHGPVINFWQAVGLLILSKIFFHGFRFGRGGGWGPRAHFRRHWEEKLASMTPDEREKFKEEWRRRCRGPWGAGAEQKKDGQ